VSHISVKRVEGREKEECGSRPDYERLEFNETAADQDQKASPSGSYDAACYAAKV
jgi:hypothetical protein